MGMLDAWLGGREAGEDMARANAKPIDTARVDSIVERLRHTVRDADAFKTVYNDVADDPTLSAQEVIAIAQRFVGGMKPKSKKAAITAIGQERMRVSHALSKGASAAKTRLW